MTSTTALPRYQLVFQLPQTFFPSWDAMIEFEERLISRLHRTCKVDGHDIGSGTINFFVYTRYPEAAFRTFYRHIATNKILGKLRVAYREEDDDTFRILWPRRDQRPFTYW